MQKHLQIVSGPIWIFCEVWTLPTSRHSLSPTEHFIPAAWIFPLCPSGHVLSLISSKTTLKYSCNAYRIRTFTHNTCASVYSTMQTGSWDGWVLQNGKVWTCFRKIWFHCWNTGAHLLQNDRMCIQRCFFFFTLEYVYWFCYKIEKKIAWCYITLHGELSKKHKKCSENAL